MQWIKYGEHSKPYENQRVIISGIGKVTFFRWYGIAVFDKGNFYDALDDDLYEQPTHWAAIIAPHE